MHTTLFSTAYFAPIQYYWNWRRTEQPMMEMCEHYLKQSWRNRCLIATANGPMTLSIPVEGNIEKTCIKDVRLSDHGNWQHMHWNSIESAYNSSPFFEYYAFDLKPFFETKPTYLYDFNEQIHAKLCDLLDIQGRFDKTNDYISEREINKEWLDLRNIIHPKKDPSILDSNFKPQPYYQVFDRKFGFLPNLSILDLLFNMGPESILYL